MFWLPGKRRRLLSDPKLLGRWAEGYGERFLKRKGFKTIARGYRCKAGEIDLVMQDKQGQIVFVEVKARSSEEFADAQDSVTPGKRQRLVRAANRFVQMYKIGQHSRRFDVVAVVLGEKGSAEIRHYENAFVP